MGSIEHGTLGPSNRSPYDVNGRGNHILQGFVDKVDESARLAISQTSADRGRVVEQTGGTLPGFYIADGAGDWFYLGGWDSVSGSINLSSFVTTENIDLYVDNVNGNDSNDGSQSNPLKTLAAAESKLPYIIAHRVIIHVLPYDTSVPNVGSYDWPENGFKSRIYRERLIVASDSHNVLASGIAEVGSDNFQVNTSGLTIDEYVTSNASIRITSGAANGDIRTIAENTASVIIASEYFSAAVSTGDSYDIVAPSISVTVATDVMTGANIITRGSNDNGNVSYSEGPFGLFVVNIRFRKSDDSALALRCIGSVVGLYGCVLRGSIDSDSPFLSGLDSASSSNYFALVGSVLGYSSNTSIVGWGIGIQTASPFSYLYLMTTHVSGFRGYLSGKSLLFVYPTNNNVMKVYATILGGRVNSVSIGGGHRPKSSDLSIVRPDGSSKFLIRNQFMPYSISVSGADLRMDYVDIASTFAAPGIKISTTPTSQIFIRHVTGTINGIGLICDEHDCNIRVHNSFDILGSPSGNDFSIDGGSTVHTADELTEGAYFRDLVADTDTGEITGSGTVIARIHSS